MILPPTSPITPHHDLLGSGNELVIEDDEEAVDLYEQENVVMSRVTSESASFITPTAQEMLQRTGKLGLDIIDDVKSRNKLLEQLSNRLHVICSTSYSAAELSDLVGHVPSSNSNSFLSSIPMSHGSSRTVSPLPQAIVSEYMERAEKELIRMDEITAAQADEIDRLRTAMAVLVQERDVDRDQFKKDRVKLRREIMELQIVVKRKDALSCEALIIAKDRLSSVSAGTQTIPVAFPSKDDLSALRRELALEQEKRLESETALREVRDALVESEKSKRKSPQLSLAIMGGVNVPQVEVLSVQKGVGADLTPLGKTTSVQTQLLSADVSVLEEQVVLLDQVIRDERSLYKSDISVLSRSVDLEQQRRNRMISVTTCTDDLSVSVPVHVGVGTVPPPAAYAALVGPDEAVRMIEDSTQCNDTEAEALKEQFQLLSEENKKVNEKYHKYRAGYKHIVDVRSNAVHVGTEYDVAVESRHTMVTPVAVNESIVQADDGTDDRLFCLSADVDILSGEKIRIAEELEAMTEQRDIAKSQVSRLKSLLKERDGYLDELSGELSRLRQAVCARPSEDAVMEKTVVDVMEQVLEEVELSIVHSSVTVMGTVSETAEEGIMPAQVQRNPMELVSIPSTIVSNEPNDAPLLAVASFAGVAVESSSSSELEALRLEVNSLLSERSALESLLKKQAEKSFADFESNTDSSGVKSSSALSVGGFTAIIASGDESPKSTVSEDGSQLVLSLQKKLIHADKSAKERSDFFKSEVARLTTALAAVNRVKVEVGTVTDHAPVEAVKVSEFANSSPKHPHPALDNGIRGRMVDYYSLGEQSPPNESELSAIVKPIKASSMLTTSDATFDFSISSLQHHTISSISPLRIPFSTPEHAMRDRDGDVVMRTAQKTNVKSGRSDTQSGFLVHEDPLDQSASPSALIAACSPLEAVPEHPSDGTSQENSFMREKLTSIRGKLLIAKSLSDRIRTLTGIGPREVNELVA